MAYPSQSPTAPSTVECNVSESQFMSCRGIYIYFVILVLHPQVLLVSTSRKGGHCPFFLSLKTDTELTLPSLTTQS